MLFLSRAAKAAAAFCCATALLAMGTPGFAVELDRPVVTSDALAASVTPNVPPTGTVPTRFAPLSPVVQPITVEQPALDPAAPPTTRFATLEAAVEAQAMPDAMADDLQCLAVAVFFESKGEPLAGQLAVAQVVRNRAASGRFPRSVCSVVTQPGQFSFVRGGRLPSVNEARRDWKVAVAVAQIALADAWVEPAPRALFFHARHLAPQWNKARVATIGNHVFYR